MEPRDATLRQARICRRAWRALGPEGRAGLVVPGNDPVATAWRATLAGAHPLADWLDGDAPLDALPAEFADGVSPRRMFASHPFTNWHPWSTRLTFPASSSTSPGW